MRRRARRSKYDEIAGVRAESTRVHEKSEKGRVREAGGGGGVAVVKSSDASETSAPCPCKKRETHALSLSLPPLISFSLFARPPIRQEKLDYRLRNVIYAYNKRRAWLR